jgi:hypothetical protein
MFKYFFDILTHYANSIFGKYVSIMINTIVKSVTCVSILLFPLYCKIKYAHVQNIASLKSLFISLVITIYHHLGKSQYGW